MLINGSKPGWDFLRGRMETRVYWFVLVFPDGSKTSGITIGWFSPLISLKNYKK